MDRDNHPALSTDRTDITLPSSPVHAETPLDTFYLHAATRPNTRKAYQSDIRQFIQWGGVLPATSELIMRYLHEQAGLLNPRTLSRRLVALRQWHQYQGFPDPTQHKAIQKTLRGIYNVHGKPKDKAQPLTLELVEQLVDYLSQKTDLTSLRNNALLQIGFFGTLRRSELVNIEFEHITFVPEGMIILIPRSKTDPTGEGQTCAIPSSEGKLCGVRALKTWLEKAMIDSGPVFRAVNRHGQIGTNALSAESVNRLLKQLTQACGLPHVDSYKGHSLRRGFVTSAIKKGVSLPALMNHGRWRDVKTMVGYYAEVQQFEENVINTLMEK
jgi:site-specific recombinase XerD